MSEQFNFGPAKSQMADATTTASGLMSATDKSKLDGIESQANKTVVSDSLSDTSTTNALSAAQGKALNDSISALNSKITTLDNKLSKYISFVYTANAVTKNGGTATIPFPTGYNVNNCAPVYCFLNLGSTNPRYFQGTASVQYFDSNGIHVINDGGADGNIYVGLVRLEAL